MFGSADLVRFDYLIRYTDIRCNNYMSKKYCCACRARCSRSANGLSRSAPRCPRSVACWAPLVPFAKTRCHLGDDTMGLVLLLLGAGSIVHTAPIDLMITDVVMPQMSGHELAREMNARRPAMKVLYISGYADQPRDQTKFCGSTFAYLEKPFSPDAMMREVRAILDTPTSSAAPHDGLPSHCRACAGGGSIAWTTVTSSTGWCAESLPE